MYLNISAAAQSDLIRIALDGMARHGPRQADVYEARFRQGFDLLAANPLMGQARPELGDPARSLIIGVHVVIYEARPEEILILRIRHQHEDWLG